jgi:hypothetical protein
MNIVLFDIPIQLEEIGGDEDPASRLLGTLTDHGSGSSFHVELVAVQEVEIPDLDGSHGALRQVADNYEFESIIEDLVELSGAGDFNTIKLDGRQYVAMIYPFSR